MKVELYTVDYCPYCKKALQFLDEKKVEYINHDITQNEDEMRAKLGIKYDIKGDVTVPQIIINDKRIGGYTDMMALYENGELNFS
ncbi:glutathione S-transferase N-terminal domain-containing protein [bacterium]|nr:glutathione S-transferase N-terminal domain-containing protein [bacterium]